MVLPFADTREVNFIKGGVGRASWPWSFEVQRGMYPLGPRGLSTRK